MRTRFNGLLAIAALSAPLAAWAQREQPSGPNPPDEAQQKKIIADTIARALAYSKELPEFVCTQVTRRNEDPKGTNQWKTLETVNEQLTFAGGKEQYRTVAVNGKKVSSEANRPGWVMPVSDFTKWLNWTFDPKAETEINWSSWDALRGHRVHVLGFRVKQEHSQYVISKGKGQPITAGFFGIINVDAESGAILKLGIVATDIPATYPVTGISLELNWEFAKIGEHYYLVPFRADQHAKEGKALNWNEIEFRDYRKPGSVAAAKTP